MSSVLRELGLGPTPQAVIYVTCPRREHADRHASETASDEAKHIFFTQNDPTCKHSILHYPKLPNKGAFQSSKTTPAKVVPFIADVGHAERLF